MDRKVNTEGMEGTRTDLNVSHALRKEVVAHEGMEDDGKKEEEGGSVLRERGNGATTGEPESSPVCDEFYLYHKLASRDTLAGLAVRYNVHLTDIKRANLIDTETGLYALHVVRIPRKPLQVGALQRLAFSKREHHKKGHLSHGKATKISNTAEAALLKLQEHYATGGEERSGIGLLQGRTGLLERAAWHARRGMEALLDGSKRAGKITLMGRSDSESGFAAPGEESTRLRKRTDSYTSALSGATGSSIEMAEKDVVVPESSGMTRTLRIPPPDASAGMEKKARNIGFPKLKSLRSQSGGSGSGGTMGRPPSLKSSSKLD